MTTNDKTGSSNSDAGNAAAKAETTASTKANAQQKQEPKECPCREKEKAGSRWIHVLILKYITGTERRSVRGQTVFALTHPFNTGYRVEYHFFALILALCRARIITIPTIHTSSLD
jgi:hypothetical protein